jgi:hypothetical protein
MAIALHQLGKSQESVDAIAKAVQYAPSPQQKAKYEKSQQQLKKVLAKKMKMNMGTS